MKRVLTFFLIAFSILVLGASVSSAQNNPNLENGLVPFGSYDQGDFDSVNVYTGNLSLHIPFLNYPQRGTLPGGFAIVNNTKSFYVQQTCNTKTQICTDMWNLSYPSGVQIVQITTPSLNYKVLKGGFKDYRAVTWDGASHEMFLDETLDATGVTANSQVPPTSLLDKTGNGYHSTTNNIWQQDTNGNYFLTASGGGSYTDTLGRTFNGTYPGPNGSPTQVQVTYEYINLQTNFKAHNLDYPLPHGPTIPEYPSGQDYVIQSIAVYDGNSWATSPTWKFEYNDRDPGDNSSINYGSLTKITLPTGGSISYTYANFALCGDGNAITTKSRGVVSRSVDANDGKGPQTTTYAGGLVTDPLGNLTGHTFTGLGGTCSFYETQVQYAQPNGHVLKTVQTAYQYQPNPLSNIVYNDGVTTVVNVLPTTITTTLDNGQVSQVQKVWDAKGTYSLGNLMEQREYDFGAGAPGPLLRRTVYTYLAFDNSNYFALNMLDRISSVTVYDGNGVKVSQTTYGYDETSPVSSGITTNHTTPAGGTLRGNQTSVKKWLNTTGGTLNTMTTFYDTGMPYQVTDPRGNVTTSSYSSTYAGGYVTQTTMPATGTVSHIVSGTYDFNIGKLTSFTDQNSKVSNYSYDSLWRISTATFPDGGQSTFTYPDNVTVQSQQKITSSLTKTTVNSFDGLARIAKIQLTSDPEETTSTDTTYDALGRVQTVSNPHRAASAPTDGITSYVYDAIGRTCVVVPPDGTTVSGSVCPSTQPSNDIFTTYSGNCTTASDQAGKSRKSCSDGLGRFTQVFEDPSTLNYETDYSYDALDNLSTVSQKGGDPNSANWRARAFTYDSLSRLLTASNPESGNITYTYDPNGNLATKVAPAPNQTGSSTVTTTYSFDALNRLTQKSYSDGTTPTVKYGFDAVAPSGCTLPTLTINNGIGKRTGMCDAAGAEAWSYDITTGTGWKTTDARTTNSVTKNAVYQSNFDGSDNNITYPSGRVITYTLAASGGNTASRYVSAVDSTGPINYATAALYAPTGALSSITNGASLVSTLYFNNRLQPCRVSVKASGTAPASCTDATAGNILDFAYNFVDGGAHNNGNVVKITNNRDTTRSINYGYDSLNRIATAYTDGNLWGETFQIDAWGNLNKILPYTGKPQPENLNQTAGPNNRFTGMSYDAAGNLLSDGVHSFVYDAENHISTGAGVTYLYDGDGRRVQKSSGTLYWFGTGSDPLDETDLTGVTTNAAFKEYIFFTGKRIARRDFSNNVSYYFTDHLGTARIVSNASGTVQDDSDFYPFGGERIVTSSSGNTYKFTGKERDAETGLDDFGARYYASNMGRFMSTDPFNIILDAEDKDHFKTYISQPQNWNRYAYTWNNPLRYVDPTGETVYVVTYTQGNEQGDEEFRKAAETRANEIATSKGFDPKKDIVLLAGINSEAGFENVIKTANGLEQKYGKVGEVDLFSHAGDRDGPNFNYGHNREGGPHYTNEQNEYKLTNLHINWESTSSKAGFYGCYTADFAQRFADRQRVSTFGFDNFSGFSSTSQGRSYGYIFGGANLYMVHRDGRPPVRRDPTKPH